MMAKKAVGTMLVILISVVAVVAGWTSQTVSQEAGTSQEGQTPIPSISVPADVEKAVAKEVKQVKAHVKKGVRKVFARTPLGFDAGTIKQVGRELITLPQRIPEVIQQAVEQSRLLGVVGSVLVAVFLSTLLYAFLGQKRVLRYVEKLIDPLRARVSEGVYPYVFLVLKIVAASLIPLVVLGMFHLVTVFVEYEAAWFLLVGRLIGLWVIAALVLNVLRELLVGTYSRIPLAYGRTIHKWTRALVLYIVVWTALFWAADALGANRAIIALLRFLVSLSVVCSVLLLVPKKRAFLSLLPSLPYRSYQLALKALDRFYLPVVLLTFLSGLLWCVGYHRFCTWLWGKTWAVAGTFLGIIIVYHLLQTGLDRWAERRDSTHESVGRLYRAIKALLLYAVIIVTVLLVLDLLEILPWVRKILSLPLLKVGTTPLSVWTIVKGVIVLVAFLYGSRLLRAYLEYKVYPALKVETGLAYAISMCVNYALVTTGVVCSLLVVGVDVRMLAVFAGALGVGLGFGLQHIVANIVSGLIIIFGGTIRKGDIIRVGDATGVVQEIGLRATLVRTFDFLEYLVPNAEFITGTVVNYTLSSPLTRLQIPVGVSYSADPEVVTHILLAQALAHPRVDTRNKPEVWFDSYGESSLNFVLLVWIDIRLTNAKQVRSELYHAIFRAFRDAGIEIPFPQRDIHIRSSISLRHQTDE